MSCSFHRERRRSGNPAWLSYLPHQTGSVTALCPGAFQPFPQRSDPPGQLSQFITGRIHHRHHIRWHADCHYLQPAALRLCNGYKPGMASHAVPQEVLPVRFTGRVTSVLPHQSIWLFRSGTQPRGVRGQQTLNQLSEADTPAE